MKSNKASIKELLEEVKTRLPSFEILPVPADLDGKVIAVIRLTSGVCNGGTIAVHSIVFDGDMMNVDYAAVKEDGSKLPDPITQPIVADIVNFFMIKAALEDAELTGE